MTIGSTFLGKAPDPKLSDAQFIRAIQICDNPDVALEGARALVDRWLDELAFGYTRDKRFWERFPSSGAPGGPQLEAQYRVTLVTATHQYSIRVSPTYLGGSALSRVADPGEQHLRGNDLHDGSFSKECFEQIMKEIIGYELLSFHPKVIAKDFDIFGFAIGVLRNKPCCDENSCCPLCLPKEIAEDTRYMTLGEIYRRGLRASPAEVRAEGYETPFEMDTMSHEDGPVATPAELEKAFRDELVDPSGHLPK